MCSYREFRAGAARYPGPRHARRRSDRRLGVRSYSTVRLAGACTDDKVTSSAIAGIARGGADFRVILFCEGARRQGVANDAKPSEGPESAPGSLMTRMPFRSRVDSAAERAALA